MRRKFLALFILLTAGGMIAGMLAGPVRPTLAGFTPTFTPEPPTATPTPVPPTATPTSPPPPPPPHRRRTSSWRSGSCRGR